MDLDQRVDVYLKQGPRPTPAQRRRCVKKARRDMLTWWKTGDKAEKSFDPDNDEQPSDNTFLAAGVEHGFSPVKGFALRERRSAQAILTTAWFRFRGDPAMVAEMIQLAAKPKWYLHTIGVIPGKKLGNDVPS